MSLKATNNVGTNSYELEIEIPAKDFEDALQKAYLKARKNIAMPGFRKGKAPRKLIEKEYGAEVFYEDAINLLYAPVINGAIDESGLELVCAPEVEVSEINKENGVLIEVEDTGDGIEEDKIKLIFDKYYRSENHKREVVGTGLGLSIVKAILKLHGYDFGVRSTVGKGSVFWFMINDQ